MSPHGVTQCVSIVQGLLGEVGVGKGRRERLSQAFLMELDMFFQVHGDRMQGLCEHGGYGVCIFFGGLKDQGDHCIVLGKINGSEDQGGDCRMGLESER